MRFMVLWLTLRDEAEYGQADAYDIDSPEQPREPALWVIDPVAKQN